MGVGVVDSGGWHDRQPGWTESRFSLRHHHEDLGIDTTSPDFGRAGKAQLKAAAMQSRAAWEACAIGLVGAAWFNARPEPWKQLNYEHWRDEPLP